MGSITKDNKRIINAWAIFDWANSAYSLVISTAIFPIYFISVTPDVIDFWGMELSNSAVFSFIVSFIYVLVAIFSPLLGGIADYGDKRHLFLRFFTTIGSLACIVLFFFEDVNDLRLGCIAFGIATLGHAASLVFYDAFLPEIASREKIDYVSAKGYAYGYTGSVLLLLFIVFMSQKPGIFGIPEESSLPYRIGFGLVGVWWLGFSQYTFRTLPRGSRSSLTTDDLVKGYMELRKVIRKLRTEFNLQRFLISFFFYSAGVQTVIYLASIFAEKELAFETAELIIIILLLQLVAIAGAYFFAYVSRKLGNKKALAATVIIWVAICIGAFYVQTKMSFYVLAAMVGLVLGGIQAISRSSYSKLLARDTEDFTSYFSFYDVLYYLSIVFGTFAFGIVDQITQNLRYSVLVLAIFFLIGLVLLSTVKFASNNPELNKIE